MQIIDNYLDTVFTGYPQTPRTEEVKRELRAMMDDVYSGAIAAGRTQSEAVGQAIAEFGSMDEITALLGVPEGETTDALPTITVSQARNFADVYYRTRWLLAWAVALFVLSPIPLVSLNLAASGSVSPMLASTVGLSILLPGVAAGVGMLIWRAQKLSAFTLITQGAGQASSGVEAFAQELKQKHSDSRTRALIIAIALWILAGLPLIVLGVFTQEMPQPQADQYLAVGMAVTLVLVACGLLVFLSANWAYAAADRLSTESLAKASGADFDRYPSWAKVFFAGYWPLMVAIYLAWSFISGSWDRSWILWPIAGVAFAAAAAGLGAVYQTGRDS